MFEMVENEGLLNERYDHFNQRLWKAGTIESRNYTSNDLTLKAMEWDRLNFTDPKKREKFVNGSESPRELLEEDKLLIVYIKILTTVQNPVFTKIKTVKELLAQLLKELMVLFVIFFIKKILYRIK